MRSAVLGSSVAAGPGFCSPMFPGLGCFSSYDFLDSLGISDGQAGPSSSLLRKGASGVGLDMTDRLVMGRDRRKEPAAQHPRYCFGVVVAEPFASVGLSPAFIGG